MLPFGGTGSYAVEGGGVWRRKKDLILPIKASASRSITVLISAAVSSAGTAGSNYQVSNCVFGVENDISWTTYFGHLCAVR
jgi:hypothetical protein